MKVCPCPCLPGVDRLDRQPGSVRWCREFCNQTDDPVQRNQNPHAAGNVVRQAVQLDDSLIYTCQYANTAAAALIAHSGQQKFHRLFVLQAFLQFPAKALQACFIGMVVGIHLNVDDGRRDDDRVGCLNLHMGCFQLNRRNGGRNRHPGSRHTNTRRPHMNVEHAGKRLVQTAAGTLLARRAASSASGAGRSPFFHPSPILSLPVWFIIFSKEGEGLDTCPIQPQIPVQEAIFRSGRDAGQWPRTKWPCRN